MMTYTKCEQCGGTGALRDPRSNWLYSCPCAKGSKTPGLLPTGVTLKQLDGFADISRALAGDPGMPEERRRAVLLRLKSRVLRALDRETADVGGEGG